ncbi:helicase with zinc finger domain 2 isoform X4 [Haplochromis burtoni]|uniref:helicase with zinc finger domain 2 isoform X4 n=1 Tax=Haplochromis burtoni TaxID=8153 RepID=UPI001C2DD78C|nr:helicase with zinc finger domain 2 isoform X4 [Haplochromis burtoni]
MSASASRLSPLLLVYDLKLVCTQCSVKEQEITYRLKSVQHKCGHNVLLCKAKGGIKWRPVSRRPIFPNPNKYMACWYYVEGRGCTQHKNRCTFARSDEEAAVWTFEKHQGLDHALLCNLIAESERGTCQANIDEPLGDLLADVDLKAVCNLCSVKVNEITYNVQSVVHKCRRSLLLAKGKASDLWKLVSKRPTLAQTVCYKVCKYIAEDSRCTQHTQGRGCTYAKSLEEATVWNYLREKKMDKNELIRLLTQSVSLTPEHAAESMLRHFSGEFIEVCKDCFQEHPQKLTTKRWNDFCAADIAHAWNPVLVYHLSENSRKHVYSQVRPLPPNCQFTYCSYVIQGKPCWHTASECQSAQSEVEMAVWKAEHTGLCVRPHLLQLSQPAQTQPRKVTMYCKVCHLSLSSPESFYKHCASLEHAQLVAQDTTTRWRGREVPHNRRAELWLCERPQTCEYGSKCPKAHSMEELQEWMMRAAEEKEIKHNIQAQGLMSYNDMLLEEYKNSSNEVYIMSEHVDDVSISCDEDSTVECQEINATLKWNFQIETERELVHVALLKQEPGASFTLGDADSEPCIYSSGEPFLREDGTYDITLSFTSINPGLYRQWLVLDFDMRPVLLKKLKVRVGHSVVTEQPAVSSGARFQSCERWHRGNRIIIPCSSRTEEQDELLKMYKPPQISFLYKSSHNIQTPLNNENYKERMHHFLYNEECAEDQVVSSSADLYVREHFHPIISKKNGGIRPIRIKANKQGTALHATDSITLKYCLLSEEGHYFLPPTKAALDQHNIIITTTTMARHFHDLNLPEGYFTHILIDEASQMLECEALMALGLAGSNTRVVLAGDHMQMGPKLLSVPDHDRSNHTLLTRLFHYYQGQNCDAAKKSRIILHENYRSTREIVEFVATHFYVGKNDFIKAAGDVPAPTNCHALKFHHVRGECLLETVSMSWYNNAEVTEVVEVVKDILKHWPASWGHKDQSSICILSEGFQVPRIRTALSSRNLANIKVERVANVQGKQFRAVIMTTVQTRDSLKTSHLPGLEMFNDARVLNTAMTRAQSHVVVIGDAAALCCFGKCSGIWKSFINHCINSNSVAPQHFTKEFFEQDIMETVKFQKFEHVDESHTLDDAILKELKDDYEQLKTDEDSLEFQMTFSNHDGSRALYNFTDTGTDLLKMCKKQPEIYKHGKFFRESHRKGYVIPFHNPTKQISIVGQANLGKAFTGDQVVLHKTEVVSITKKEESARVLLCLLEDEDHSKSRQNSESKFIRRMMIPIKKSEPKICILILKKQRNYMPIWEEIDGEWTVATQKYIDENLKQNSLFKVQVICWNKDNFFPLGYIIDILPVGSSLDSGLKILNEEFKVAYHPCKSDKAVYNTDENNTNRQDLRKIITFTVDPAKAKILDDAISVRELEDHYELGLHIADVASVVKPGDDFDRAAEQSGTTYYCAEEKPIYMFPQDLSIQLSLQEGQDRRVVSLMFKAEKDTNKITGKPKFQLSTINSDKQLSYLEAEDIISKSYKETPKCDTVEHCVTVAYCFAKAQRKIRLESDWAYSQTDADRLPGQRKAHLMIEELAVLFNQHASKTLISCDKTRYSTPLRCQAKPDPVKVEEFKEECGEFIPLSFLVRHKVDHEQQSPKCQNFRILPEVWKEIVAATRTDDTDKMIDLVAADEIHPLVQPVTQKFRRCFSKAYFICSKSSPEAEIGHYSLNLKSYTKASSPIRQYMDVILQRLLHSYICNTDVQYTKSKIMALCSQFQENLKNAEKYEQKAEQISYAVSMKKQSASKIAFVVHANPEEDSFAVAFPFNKNIFVGNLRIMYKDLQLDDQPFYDEEKHSVTLKWKRRIYSADAMQIHQELKMMADSHPCIEVPLRVWKDTIEAIDNGKLDHAKCLIMHADADLNELGKQTVLPQSSEGYYIQAEKCLSEEQEIPEMQTEHFVDIQLALQPGDILQVQLTSSIKRGYQMPTVQLVHIKPKFEMCVDHVNSPITCFSRLADIPSRTHYNDTKEYIRIWKPLCEMESAANAVNESDIIIIENLQVKFNQELEGILKGSFFLPLQWINEWAIEFNLRNCFLCIRKRGLKLETSNVETSNVENSTLVDPKEFTWVAHGFTSNAEKLKNGGSKVEFYISHLPMETIPECVFQKNTHYTVEIIPKLIPDIRKENAVVNITLACDFVKAIALGQRIPKEVKSSLNIVRRNINGLPELNQSQHRAVDKALNNTFTLIQGPPGTGKTVVGVYIVHSFFEHNSKNKMKLDDPKDKEKKKVILYCGPSNKSVDVVAGYLMRFKDSLRPLRVYSQEVEMLDFPFPDCKLQFSQRTLRQDHSKPELRDITMHHRMRQDQNIYSVQIRDFDKRIKLAFEKKGELTAEEVKEYKNLLRDARAYELQQHDIILCTCTQSSTPVLTKTVTARQILIDECAMATEPQALIPLVCNKPEKIVLIGDHKQLRPIVRNEFVRKLGMAKSLFERYYTIHEKRAVMLDIQYRMHEDICEFPSNEFYDGNLKTGVEQQRSVFQVDHKTKPIVFGDVKGKTISLVVNTAQGNQNSKANLEERNKVITIAEKLVKTARIAQQSIVILSPYNAQVSEIRNELKKKKMEQIPVTTITKSQGSEWRYVILSTVCSLPNEEIEKQPERSWLSKHLGFVGDPNQINVAITRAKEGLCIIGDQELLMCSPTWRHLLNHYTLHNAVTGADKISVCSAT